MAASIHKLRIQRRSGNDRKRCKVDFRLTAVTFGVRLNDR